MHQRSIMNSPHQSTDPHRSQRKLSLLQAIGPGILVAATGVGAGDLAGGALAGSRLKLTVLWVVLVGAALKYVLCEGLARWQLKTGDSVSTGVFQATSAAVRWGFLAYVAIWSFCIGGMLMSACGECAQAILPVGDPAFGRIVHGCIHSLMAIALVRIGGFRLFETLMTVCIGVMFFTVLLVATLSGPDWMEVGRGLLVPTVPNAEGKGVAWTLTLMAGVGGTLTMLCYGTWIREKERTDFSALKACRIDLSAGYLMTAVFGIAMVILGSQLPIDQGLKGANLITSLADNIQTQLGDWGLTAAWMFRLGAWGAVFSSLLGVWQSVPELICEMLPPNNADSNQKASRSSKLLFALGIIPCFVLPFSLAAVQKIAGVTGAVFIPLFASALLALPYTNRGREAGFRNGILSNAILLLSLCLFGGLAVKKVIDVL